jgi:hypothetical protein
MSDLKLRGILAAALIGVGIYAPSLLAQSNPGLLQPGQILGNSTTSPADANPVSTGTGVLTALGNNVGSSGAVAVLSQIETWTGAQSFTDGTFILLGSGSGSSTVKAPATGGGTATLFAGSDTVAGKSLANGGTNNTMTASNGGIVWSDAAGLNVMPGTATARLPLLSGASTLPVWGTFTLPASVNSGGVPYFSSAGAMGSSATLTNNGVLIGAGVTNPPVALAAGTNGQLLLGVTGAAPQMATLSQDCTVTNAGVITCPKTNNVAFTSYATAATGQLAGTATNDNASAGNIGEYNIATGTSVSLTSATPANVTSVSLTAGDWDVWGQVSYNPAATTSFTNLAHSIGTASATIVGVPTQGVQNVFPVGQVIGNNNWSAPPVRTRFSFASTTTVFLVAQATFTVSTMTVSGSIQYRRER